MKKYLFILFVFAFFTSIKAERLYWVGGSGNFNDPAHWSLASGGKGGAKIPTQNDDVVFDNSSFRSTSIVKILGEVNVHDFNVEANSVPFYLEGSKFSRLVIAGSLKGSSALKNNFEGKTVFTSSQTEEVLFGPHLVKGDVVFEGTGYFRLTTFQTAEGVTVSFNKGEYFFNGTAIHTTNIIADKAKVKFNFKFAMLKASELFILGDQVELVDSALYIEARIDESSLYQVSPEIKFSDKAQIISSNKALACAFPLLSTVNPSCAGVCDAVVRFSIPATCAGTAGPPYQVTWTSGANPPCPVPPFNNAVTPGIHTVNDVCGCQASYTVIFADVNGAFAGATIVSPVDPPSISAFFSQTEPTCFGSCDGRIDAVIVGGTQPYSVLWSPPGAPPHTGITGIDFIENQCIPVGLSQLYTVEITDSKGCEFDFSTTLTQPSTITPMGSSQDANCFGFCDGYAVVNPNGGNGGYTFVWDSNAALNNDTLPALCAGTAHSVVVTDSEGCTATYSTSISGPTDFTYNKSNPADLSCFDVNDGVASISSVSGATPPYTYTWLGAPAPVVGGNATTSIATSLGAGTYTVIVTDALGCDDSTTFTINAPAELIVSVATTDVSCFGDNDGTATASHVGGTGPSFTYLWYASTGLISFDPTVTNLEAGTYSLVVVDDENCNDTVVFTINEPPLLVVTATGSNPLCFGSSDGQVCGTAVGGTGTIDYSFSPLVAGAVEVGDCYTNIPAGNYIVTGTDDNGCTSVDNVTITSPTKILANLTYTDPTCKNACNGTATANASGGSNAGYIYSWSCDASGLQTITGQCAGKCVVTITDGSTCFSKDSVTFVDPNLLTVTINNTNVNCSGASTAQITTVVAGGTGPYTYLWNPTALTTPGLSNVGAGTYDVIVTDSKSCTATGTVTVTSPPAITITTNPVNPSCFEAGDGSISTVLGGGTPPYDVLWLPINQITPNISNLDAGTYTIRVTDNLNCLQTATVVLTDPSEIVVTTDSTLTTCIGLSTGTATASAIGGDNNYNYLWSDGQTTQTATNLDAGNYFVTVTDGQGCTGLAMATVTEPTALSVLVNGITPSCTNINNGTANAVPNGGTSPYTFIVDGVNVGSGTALSALGDGNHTLVVQDNNGCTDTTTFVVPVQVTLTVTTSATQLTCAGDCNGTITANVNGATGSIDYLFDAPLGIDQTVNPATGLCAGVYTVTITDGIGCQVSTTVTFTDPIPLTATIGETAVDCNGNCTGIATATPVGGVAPYTISWSNGVSGTNNPNLCVGTYTATIVDNSGCTIAPIANITEPTGFVITNTSTPPSTCGGADGCLTVNVSGGSNSYNYSWSVPAPNAATVCGLSAGAYSVTITDAVTGCDTLVPFGISDPNSPIFDSDSSNVTCSGLSDGSITITVTTSTGVPTITFPGGTPTGPSPLTASGLAAGSYVVQITDATACATFQSVVITEPEDFKDNPVISHISCNGVCDGSIVLSPTGGTRPFSYFVDGSVVADDSSMTGLCAGTHTVVITDAKACSYTFNYTLTQPQPFTLSETHTNVSCITGFGTGTAVPTGGNGGNTYSWSAPSVATTITANDLTQGTYTCVATDIKGCTASVTVTIGQNPPLVSGFTFNDNLCAAGCSGSASFNASGGSGVYTYGWSHDGSLTTPSETGICSGTFNAVVRDDNGCEVIETYTISSPALLTATVSSIDPTCFGGANGCITATPAGGVAPYTYNWVGAVSITQTACNLSAGDYTVNVTDANGCATSQISTLDQPSDLIANVTPTEPTCFGTCDGVLASDPSGGIAPYTFSWGPAPSTGINDSLINLCAGTYYVVVTDNNGCEDSVSFDLQEPLQLGLAYSVSPATCGLVPCDGVITINNIIGNTVEWSDGFTGLEQDDMCAGIEPIIVRDINGCVDTVNVLVNTGSGPVVDIDSTNTSCIGSCDGTATIVSLVGVGPYTYTWQPGVADVDSIAENLCVGTYTSQVTDASGCITLTEIDINEPAILNDNEVIVPASCNGVSNGSITLAPTGGTGAYSYDWSNGAPDAPSISNLAPGSYTVVITDGNACTRQFIYNVGANAVVQYQLSVTNASCFGKCDGAAMLNNIAGGTAPYSFTWSDGQSGTTVNMLCAGSYSVTIADAVGCIRSIDTTITEPTQVIANPVITNTDCGVCAGSVALSPVGGTGAFTYDWSDGQTTATASNLCAGIYMVNVTDAASCLSQFNIAVNNTSGPSLTVSSTNVNCSDQCAGTASVVAAGGTTPYQYNWINGGQTTSSVTNLCVGTYFVQVKDAGNCIINDSVVIAAVNTISAVVNASATTCGNSVGQASVVPSGGTAPYSFVWSTGDINDTISNLAAGIYWVEVTDASACKDTFFVTVNSNSGPTVSVTTDSVLCNGGSNGSATLTLSGGNTPYTVLWSTGAADDPTLSGLNAGDYSVMVTDATGCITVKNFSIEEPEPISLSLNNTILPTCQTACNGVLTAIPNGGTLPYSYLWNPSGLTTASISNQCAGLHSVVVTDANGCTTAQNTQLVNNPNPFNVTEVNTNATCGLCDGSSTLTLSGGQAPYTYLWSNDSTGASVSGLCAGVYMIDISDNAGCTQQYNIAIDNNNGPTVTASSTDVTCEGSCNGTASTVVSGGTTPYTYNWIGVPDISPSVSNLCVGTYFVQVKDAANCLTNAEVTINAATILVANEAVTPSTCGLSDGAITLTPTGGLGVYTYSWSNGLPPNSSQANLAAGNYSVEISDAGGCKDTVLVSISSSNAPGVVIDVDSVSCFGLSDGSATLTISGGTIPYTIAWSSSPSVNPTLGGLSAGTYAVSVTDGANCVSAQNFTIEEPGQVSLSLNNTQLPNCSGVCNGELVAIPTGGNLSYSYLWMPGSLTTESIGGLCAGSYTLTVTDATGCTATQITQLNNNPVPFVIDTAVVLPGCNMCDGIIDLILIGGATPYTYSWSTSATTEDIDSVCAGVYQVLITDSIGCSQTASFAISNQNGITNASIVETNETCLNACDGTASVTPVGGTPDYTYLWLFDGTTDSTHIDLCANNYFVEITDSSNCKYIAEVIISSPNQMTATTAVVAPNCGASDGSIVLNVSGGTGPLNYSWNPPVVVGNTNIATNIAAGVYTITVTESSAVTCSQEFVVTLSSVNGPQVQVLDSSITCNGLCDGSITLAITNVNPTTVLWNNAATDTAITNLCGGTYTAIITDAILGCSTSISATITEPDTITFGNPIVSDISCFGLCNGSISTVAFGGTLPYTYSWSPIAESGPLADSLCANAYTVTITDNNACVVSQTTTLVEPIGMTITGVVTPAACSSVPSGAIDVTVSGGTPGYTFQWITGSAATTEDLNGVLYGNYSIEVTDTLLCKDTASFSISTTDTVTANAGADFAFCLNNTATLDGSSSFINNGTITYQWNELITGSLLGNTDSVFVTPTAADTISYQLIVTNSLGCSDTDTVALTVNALPIANAGSDIEIMYGLTSAIGGNPTASANTSLVWTPNINLSATNIPNPVSSTTVTTTYVVTVTDTLTGCVALDSMEFVILPQVIIPNGISPNGDGKNDTWIISLINKFPDNEVEIYNRWGELLYYKQNYDNTWDGTYKGKGLPVGTYYYVVKLNDPKYPEPYTGPITIFK